MKQASHFQLFSGWALVLKDMGLEPAEVLTRAGLPQDLFQRAGAGQKIALSVPQYFALWQGMEAAAGQRQLPLLLAENLSVESFDPPLFAALCSPDLNTALARIRQYKPLIGPLLLTLEQCQQGTELRLTCYGENQQLPPVLALTELVFFTQLARMATRERIVPVSLHCPELPADPAPYEDYFGQALIADGTTRICFSPQDSQRPFLTHNPGMWQQFEPGLSQRLQDLDSDASTAQRVKSALLELLPAGYGQLEAVADKLAMSKRTLQRRLAAEDKHFQQVLDATRRELAEHYLSQAHGPLSSGEIGFLLGYRDTTSFYRAFSAWTGQTPEQFRQARWN